MGTQYHMARYAYLYESTILADATAVAPALPQDSESALRRTWVDQALTENWLAAVGLRAIVETIDNRADFTKYMQNYNAARGPVAARAPKKDGPYEDGFVSRLVSTRTIVLTDRRNTARRCHPYRLTCKLPK